MNDDQTVRVSYLISTRNRAEYLDKTLANVREFITTEDELIIMDGGSTDRTADVVKKHADIVTVFRSEPDCGEAHGYNKGILASRGRYLKLITDDDYIYPEGMRQAIAIMESQPDIDALICGGESYVVDPQTQESRYKWTLWLSPYQRTTDALQHIFAHVCCGLGLVLTRRVIERVGLFDTSYLIVDTEYMARLLERGVNFDYADLKLFQHTEHPHSGMKRKNQMLRDAMRIVKRMERWDIIDWDHRHPNGAVILEISRSLDRWPKSGTLSQWLQCGERLRRSRLKFIYWMVLRGSRIPFGLKDAIKKALRPQNVASVETSGNCGTSAGPTPEWTGTTHRLELKQKP